MKQNNYEYFLLRGELNFNFLKTEFGCKLIGEEKNSWGGRIIFKNNTTGVVLIYNLREGVYAYIVKLENGEIGDYTFSRWLPIYLLKDLNKREKKALAGNLFNLYKKSYIDAALRLNAEILHREGAEILKGNFLKLEKIMEKIQAKVKKAAASN